MADFFGKLLKVVPLGEAEFVSPPQAIDLVGQGIATGEAFGSPVIAGPILAISVASGEAFGAPTVANIRPDSVVSGEAFGVPTMGIRINVTAGIPSAEAFGTPIINTTVMPDGVVSGEAFGSPVVAGPIKLRDGIDGIVSGEAFGTPRMGSQILPSSVPSGEAFGNPTVAAPVVPDSVVSSEAFGTVVVAGPVNPISVAPGELFGTPIISGPILPDSIASAEAFGTLSVVTESIDTPFVSTVGGQKVTLQLPAVQPGTFIVRVGLTGSALDETCYAGFGKGTGDVITMLANSIDLILPPLPIGGPYRFFLVRQSGSGDTTFLTIPLVSAVPQDFRGRTLSLRRVLPRHWKLGARDIDLVSPQVPKVAGQFIETITVTTGEAFGSPVIAGPILAASVSTGEAFGTPTVST